jgi:C4-dicarboxylate transporter, DctM subunit
MTVAGLLFLPFLLLFLRQNLVLILFCMAAYIHFFFGDGVLEYIVEDMWIGLDKEVLLSVPLFILCGNVMTKGQIAHRLIHFVAILTSPLPGGLAVATILSCAVFAAISGSSAVTLLSVGAVMYPALLEAGYDKKFALGALASGGTLGVIIPPSIPMILYGIVTETSITDLFKAGIIPGLILTGLMAIYALYVNWNIPRKKLNWPALFASFRQGVWSLLMPIILLGGIYSGYFTPTEAAAVALGYALLIEVFVHRDVELKEFYDVALSTAKLLGALYPLLAIAMSLNLLLTAEQVPQNLTNWVAAQVESPITFLLAINVLLLIVGCFLDINAGILILAPILLPLALNFGIDPVHLGIIMVINLEVGFLTPPIGINLMIAMTAFEEKFSLICQSVIPFVIMIICVVALVTFSPSLALFFIK